MWLIIFLARLLIYYYASVASHTSSEGNSVEQCEEQMPYSSA